MKRILPFFCALALLLTGCTAVSTTESASQTISQVDSSSQESALESDPSSASSQLESAGEVSITDSNGSQIALNTHSPRVVAAYGSFAEAWLLAGGELVGVTQDALEERDLGLGKDVVNAGSLKTPSAELILAARAEKELMR